MGNAKTIVIYIYLERIIRLYKATWNPWTVVNNAKRFTTQRSHSSISKTALSKQSLLAFFRLITSDGTSFPSLSHPFPLYLLQLSINFVLVSFYGISILVGYIMPNSLYMLGFVNILWRNIFKQVRVHLLNGFKYCYITPTIQIKSQSFVSTQLNGNAYDLERNFMY